MSSYELGFEDAMGDCRKEIARLTAALELADNLAQAVEWNHPTIHDECTLCGPIRAYQSARKEPEGKEK